MISTSLWMLLFLCLTTSRKCGVTEFVKLDKVQQDGFYPSCSLPKGSRPVLLFLCQEIADIMFAHMEQRSEFFCLEYKWKSLVTKKQNKATCSEASKRLLRMWNKHSFLDARDNFTFYWIIEHFFASLGNKSMQSTKGKKSNTAWMILKCNTDE